MKYHSAHVQPKNNQFNGSNPFTILSMHSVDIVSERDANQNHLLNVETNPIRIFVCLVVKVNQCPNQFQPREKHHPIN